MDTQKGPERDAALVRPDNAVEDLELPANDSEQIVGGLPAVQKKLAYDDESPKE